MPAPAAPASVLYLAGDAWKLDAKGNQTPLEEGMDIDELEGVKTSPTAFVSLLLGDGSRIVLPSSSEVTCTSTRTPAFRRSPCARGRSSPMS